MGAQMPLPETVLCTGFTEDQARLMQVYHGVGISLIENQMRLMRLCHDVEISLSGMVVVCWSEAAC